MSIHTIIQSNIYNLSDLTQILDSQGIHWKRLQKIPKLRTWGSGDAHCVVEAKMNGEIVIIYQKRPGESFIFQSEDWRFRNRSSTEGIALEGMEQIARKKEEEERQRKERERREEQGRQEQYKRLCEKMENTSAEADWHALAIELRQMKGYRNTTELANKCDSKCHELRASREVEEKRLQGIAKIAKEEGFRKLTEEQEEEREKQRLQELEKQAADALRRLDEEAAAKRQERNRPNIDSFSKPSSGGSLNDVIGKFHQQNALRKIMESLETLDRDTGLSLYSQKTLEDETIELTLRG